MKKEKNTEKKLSLKKIQMIKILKRPLSIKGGGSGARLETGQTVVDQTYGGN
ncbi:hypothetical protein CHRY9293_02506 [Chryseobacterium potabilaquae]|uniref:Uncharacterized protein n=1 Tax=Chryseobacterium potabilaquae TaxID=2675057 RepID=A0A6N4XA29_9FLAO|nr:hypothetical protein CHRY9293_02506 [Chryseobacterium potabilaquae]